MLLEFRRLAADADFWSAPTRGRVGAAALDELARIVADAPVEAAQWLRAAKKVCNQCCEWCKGAQCWFRRFGEGVASLAQQRRLRIARFAPPARRMQQRDAVASC